MGTLNSNLLWQFWSICQQTVKASDIFYDNFLSLSISLFMSWIETCYHPSEYLVARIQISRHCKRKSKLPVKSDHKLLLLGNYSLHFGERPRIFYNQSHVNYFHKNVPTLPNKDEKDSNNWSFALLYFCSGWFLFKRAVKESARKLKILKFKVHRTHNNYMCSQNEHRVFAKNFIKWYFVNWWNFLFGPNW